MGKHICPWYLGYLLASPLRRFFQNPENILSPYVAHGMKVLEIGPGMGFFSLPLGNLVGKSGKIFCIDLQEKMLKSLKRRVVKAKFQDRIETRLCSESSLEIHDLKGAIDFALAFAVVHEVPDQKRLFADISNALKQGGRLLISEPKGHVTKEQFQVTISISQNEGMKMVSSPEIPKSHSALLEKVS